MVDGEIGSKKALADVGEKAWVGLAELVALRYMSI